MNLDEYDAERRDLNQKINAGITSMAEAGARLAQAEHDYRRFRMELWAKAPTGTVPERQAWVDGNAARMRMLRDQAEFDRDVAREAQRSRRQQMSALQTLLAAHRAEAEYVRTGPGAP